MRLRPTLLPIVLSATAAGIVAATVVAAPQTPVFKSSVTLVTVDVTVLDSEGRPVAGLTADDFQVKLDGRVHPVRALSFVKVAQSAAPIEAMDVPPEVTGRQVVTNATTPGESKVFVLMVDDLSYSPGAGRSLFEDARRWIATQPVGVFVGLTTTSGAVVVNPTLDRAAVAAAFGKVTGDFNDPRRQMSPTSPSVGISEAIDIVEHNDMSALGKMLVRECFPTARFVPSTTSLLTSDNQCATEAQSSVRVVAAQMRGLAARQVGAIVGAIRAMKGASGLKQLVLLSGGIGVSRDAMTTFAPISRAAAEAGVQLSVLVEDAGDIDMGDTSNASNSDGQRLADTGIAMRRREDKRMFKSSMQTLADVSGGTFETVIGSAERAFNRAASAGSAVYRVGVEPPQNSHEGKPITVAASVRRKGVTVHANRQAVLPGERAAVDPGDQIKAAITEGQPLFSVPIRMSVVRRRASAGQVELGVGLEVPGTVAGPLSATFGLVDSSGTLKSGTRSMPSADPTADYRLTFPIPVAPGQYVLRFAVADAMHGVGSAELAIDARLATMGTLQASDVLTWWKDASGTAQFLALDRIPNGVESLGAGLELYPQPGTPFPENIKVKLSIIPAGGKDAVAEAEVLPLIGGNMLRAEAMLPVAGIKPGTYVLKATVSAGGQRLGEASALIKKN